MHVNNKKYLKLIQALNPRCKSEFININREWWLPSLTTETTIVKALKANQQVSASNTTYDRHTTHHTCNITHKHHYYCLLQVNLASMIAINPKGRVAKKILGGQMPYLTKMNPYLNSDNLLIH